MEGGGYVFTVFLIYALCFQVDSKYEPNWESIDSRPLPSWYDESKVGIFMHWGVFSVPAFGVNESAFLWLDQKQGNPTVLKFLKNNYRPDWTYADFASDLTTEFFDPDQWADIFKASGAR